MTDKKGGAMRCPSCGVVVAARETLSGRHEVILDPRPDPHGTVVLVRYRADAPDLAGRMLVLSGQVLAEARRDPRTPLYRLHRCAQGRAA